MLGHLIYLISLCFVYNLSKASRMISIGLDNCDLTYEVLFTFDFRTERELACSMDVFRIFLIGVGHKLQDACLFTKTLQLS